MTAEEQKQITSLRMQGLSQAKIASKLNLNVNAVKSWCRRHPIDAVSKSVCLYCGKPTQQQPNRKEKKFCSDKCRAAWWSEHPEKRAIRKAYHHVCKNCGTEFDNNRLQSVYCSQSCYADARRKEAPHDR